METNVGAEAREKAQVKRGQGIEEIKSVSREETRSNAQKRGRTSFHFSVIQSPLPPAPVFHPFTTEGNGAPAGGNKSR